MSARTSFSLVPATHGAPVAGLVIDARNALGLLERIDWSLPHYRALSLVTTRQHAILLAGAGAALPWGTAVETYLSRQGPLFVPVTRRLNVAPGLEAQASEDLARQHGLPQPLLLLPVGREGAFKVISLARARPLCAADVDALAAAA